MSQSKTTGRCRLCGQMAPLCRSHIVPELAYKQMRNSKRQIHVIGSRVGKVQIGYRERLLCSRCEGILSGYERSFAQAWMETIPHGFSHLKTRTLHDLISVKLDDYAAFKLLHLSVLWRAAVSSGFKVNRSISLGPYEDQIAELVRSKDPGKPGDFPVVGVLNLGKKKEPVPTVSLLAEGQGRLDGCHFYLMSYAYCDWYFVVARPGPPWLVRFEEACRRKSIFLLLVQPFEQAKSFNLCVRALRDLSR